MQRRRLLPLALAHAAVLTACSSTSVQPAPAAVPPSAPAVPVPDHAQAHESLADLSFLSGRWVAENPNGTVNEEVWLPVRGNVALGLFRQVRLDGDCSFAEVSQIAREDDRVLLRLRHLHGLLEVPEGRADVSLFELVDLAPGRVEFRGAGAAEQVSSVVYERTGPRSLEQSVGFAEGTGQAPFVTRYRLDG
ncbi:MAG: DUF6265 family protein [Planctomycetota bacterium]